MNQLLRTKNIDKLIAESEEPEHRLRKSLGPWSLTALGIGAVIGSGIFTLTGTAAAGKVEKVESILHATVLDLAMNGAHAGSLMGRPGAGPAITLSFVLVAIACLFAGLCYAELASMIPIAGSAYTYAYAILGEIFAWIIGWDLILEYAVSNMSVAVGFSAYLQDLGDNLLGWHLPAAIAYPAFPAPGQPAGIFNIPALLITLLVTWVLVRGVKESAGANTTMVLIKMAAIVIFCVGAAGAIHPGNWKPFAPHGFSGVLTGASLVFFTYIGFDSVSTAAEECKMPQRDMPFGIIATLIVCTILYGSVALVLTGIAHYETLNNDSPVAFALKALGYNRLKDPVAEGKKKKKSGDVRRADGHDIVAAGLSIRAGARLVRDVARDGLLPGHFQRALIHKVYQDAATHQHVDRRALWSWVSSRFLGYRHLRGAFEYRNSVRVHRGLGGSDRTQEEATGPPQSLPCAAGPACSAALNRLLPAADDGPAAADLDPLLPLADYRPCGLCHLRQKAQRHGISAQPVSTELPAGSLT